jgi:hypothetical protein
MPTEKKTSPKVNYSIRPNKSIERKLIFEILKFLDKEYVFNRYSYIGFGSLWFVDFIMAHRILGINEFHSIETTFPNRAEFNQPYEFITVYPGDSDDWLPSILNTTKKNRLIWLDYETTITDEIVQNDLDTLASGLKHDDIFLITLNAESKFIRQMPSIQDPLKARFEFLKSKVGDSLASADPESLKDNYSGLLASTVFNIIEKKMNGYGNHLRIECIFNFEYQDGAKMMTVGFRFIDASKGIKISTEDLLNNFKNWLSNDLSKPTLIKVPELTVREKIALDRIISLDGKLPLSAIKEKYNFELEEDQVNSYSTFKNYYPSYFELLV